MNRLDKPLLIFDGECGLCRDWVERLGRLTGGAVAFAPYQEVAPRFPEISIERFRAAVHLREPDGRWSRGAEAVARTLARAPGHGAWLWLYRRLPGFAAVSEWSYRWVARNRPLLARLGRRGGGGRPRDGAMR